MACPSLCLALFMRNIQSLMKYFSSTFGFMVMIVIPMGMVYKYRIRFELSELTWGKLNRSLLSKKIQLLILALISFGIFTIIIIGFFNTNNKTCVYQ